jgi:RNA polymerase sigma-70 factor, ECF subfamily
MPRPDPNTEQLLRRARENDASAISALLESHRAQLKRAVVVRFDRRLAGRVDPSDVVQEAMAEAARRFPNYLSEADIPFYPWLRAIAMNRLTDVYRHHVLVRKRSVKHEQRQDPQLTDDSMMKLAGRLAAPGPSPSAGVRRQETRERVGRLLERLDADEREVLILAYLEEMPFAEIAFVQGVTERTVRRRHRQAIDRLAQLIKQSGAE